MKEKKNDSQDQPYVSPHVLKLKAKKERAQARLQRESSKDFLKNLWAGISAMFRPSKSTRREHTPPTRRDPWNPIRKAIQPGRHRRQPVVPR